jgi:hypothetical protein
VLSLDNFAFILNKNVNSWKGLIHNKTWEFRKLSDRVKLYDQSYEYHYRFSLEEWETIRQQFAAALLESNLAK